MTGSAEDRPACTAGLLDTLCRLADSRIPIRPGRYDDSVQRWIDSPDNVPPPKGMEKPPKDFDEVIRVLPPSAGTH